WCGKKLVAANLTLDDLKKPTRVTVGCDRDTCPFCPSNHPDGVPVVFVDEQVYRELPAFIVGTVDKFAMVPWRAEAGMLFGRAAAFRGREMIAPGETVPKGSVKLPDGLRPPHLLLHAPLPPPPRPPPPLACPSP